MDVGQDCLYDYFETRNGLLGPDYSSKLSPWLANGNIYKYIYNYIHDDYICMYIVGLLGPDYSSKLSPWLANGNIMRI